MSGARCISVLGEAPARPPCGAPYLFDGLSSWLTVADLRQRHRRRDASRAIVVNGALLCFGRLILQSVHPSPNRRPL